MNDEMIAGTEIKIGRTTMIVPPLNFKSLRRLKPQLDVMSSMEPSATITDEYLDAMIEIVHTAIVRNYPNYAREQLEEDFDIGNAAQTLRAVMSGSGLVSRGEATPGTGK